MAMPTHSSRKQRLADSEYPVGRVGGNELQPHHALAELKHFYRLHSRDLYSFCAQMVADRGEAETLMRDAFLRCVRLVDAFQPGTISKTLLFRSVISVLEVRNNTDPRHLCHASAADHIDEAMALGAIGQQRLKDAIAELPANLRVVFVLRDVLGYEHCEIAEILGSSLDDSKVQAHRARLCVREALYREMERHGTNENLHSQPGGGSGEQEAALAEHTKDIKAGKPREELRSALVRGQAEEQGWPVRKDGSQFWAIC